MGCLGCDKTCACFVVAGTGIVVTGTGNAGSPYTINAIGASEYTDDTCSIAISGDGTIGTPLTADAILNPGGCLVCTADLGLGVVTDSAGCIECGEDGLTLFLDPDGGLTCAVTGLGILLDPAGDASLSGDGLLIVAGGTVAADDPITGDGSGGSPLALALDAAGGLDVVGGELTILLDPATDPSCGSLSADGLLISCGGGGGSSNNDVRWTRLASDGAASAQDDEFRNAAIGGGWSRVDANAGNITWVEGGDSLSATVGVVADAAGEIHGYMQALVLAVDDSISLHFRGGGQNSEFPMCGLIVADGTTVGAGNQIVFGVGDFNNDQVLLFLAAWTGYDTRTAVTDYNSNTWNREFHLKLRREAADEWRGLYSVDGVQWHSAGTRNLALTPSHVGVMMTSWGSSTEHQFSIDYFRRQTG